MQVKPSTSAPLATAGVFVRVAAADCPERSHYGNTPLFEDSGPATGRVICHVRFFDCYDDARPLTFATRSVALCPTGHRALARMVAATFEIYRFEAQELITAIISRALATHPVNVEILAADEPTLSIADAVIRDTVLWTYACNSWSRRDCPLC